jgi:hypothetical protein
VCADPVTEDGGGALMQKDACPTASMPSSPPPLLVLTSERAPRPWSTRCRFCPWVSQQAASLDEARREFASHSCRLAVAEPSQATTAGEHARRPALQGSGGR